MTILHDGDTHSSAAAAAPVSKEEAKQEEDDDEKQHPLAGSAHSSGSSGSDGFEVVGQRCVLVFCFCVVRDAVSYYLFVHIASTPPCLLP